jgi:DNA polymerase epsilon subunit 1
LQESRLAWLQYHKKKWSLQAKQRSERNSFVKRARIGDLVEGQGQAGGLRNMGRNPAPGTLGGFLRRAHRTLLDTPWQIVQVTVNPDILYRNVMKC